MWPNVFFWEYGPIPNIAGRLALIVSSGASRMYRPRRGRWLPQCTCTDLQYSYWSAVAASAATLTTIRRQNDRRFGSEMRSVRTAIEPYIVTDCCCCCCCEMFVMCWTLCRGACPTSGPASTHLRGAASPLACSLMCLGCAGTVHAIIAGRQRELFTVYPLHMEWRHSRIRDVLAAAVVALDLARATHNAADYWDMLSDCPQPLITMPPALQKAALRIRLYMVHYSVDG